jgi:hypothetical protein
MKRCNRCKQEKQLNEFNRRNKGLQPYCIPCKREYDREFYKKTADKRRERKSYNSKVIRIRNADLIKQYLLDKSCIDCGIADPIVLEFDHRNPEEKSHDVSNMVGWCFSKENILEEIAKCDIRCANCHRRKTAKQFGWMK